MRDLLLGLEKPPPAGNSGLHGDSVISLKTHLLELGVKEGHEKPETLLLAVKRLVERHTACGGQDAQIGAECDCCWEEKAGSSRQLVSWVDCPAECTSRPRDSSPWCAALRTDSIPNPQETLGPSCLLHSSPRWPLWLSVGLPNMVVGT